MTRDEAIRKFVGENAGTLSKEWSDGAALIDGLVRLELFSLEADAVDDYKWAFEIADWCQRCLDEARTTGRFETRPFVQNAALIIKSLRYYGNKEFAKTLK